MADQAGPLLGQDEMTGLDRTAVECPVDNTIAEKCLEVEPAYGSCKMGFG